MLESRDIGIRGFGLRLGEGDEMVGIDNESDKKESPQCRKASLYKTDLSKLSKYLPQRGHHPLSSIHEFSV